MITHVIAGLSQGGAENVLFRLIAAQPEPARHSVISLTDEGVFGLRLRELGVEVRCLGLRRAAIPSPLTIVRLCRWIRELRPSVVQTWMYHADLLGGLAARLAGCRVCWGLHHSDLSKERNSKLTLLVAQLNARLSGWLPERTVSCSARAIEIHRALGYRGPFDLIPNGLDLTRFVPAEPAYRASVRESLGLPGSARVIGHVGRSHPQKDHATLLGAFGVVAAKHPDVWLLLAGSDLCHGNPYMDGLIAKTGTLAVANRILALGQRDDVPDLMNAMDLFVLSSLGEAFPNVLIEAMACATPCVATDAGDSAEIIRQTGWVCRPGDMSGLADAILSALAEPDHALTERGLKARERVLANYGIERMLDAYEATWKKAICA